jgi:phage shock protein PspC (stress-responsive transcriptional regulator)
MTQMPLYKQLRRSRTDRMLAGICGGVARYFAVDPIAVRVAFVVLAFITGGTAVLAYLVAWLVMPAEPLAPASYQSPASYQTDQPAPPAA